MTRQEKFNRARAASLARVQSANNAARPVLAPSTIQPIAYVRKSHGTKLTATQESSGGGKSEWCVSQNYRAGRNPQWDRLASWG